MPIVREVKFLVKHGNFKKGDITFLPVAMIAELGKKVKVTPGEPDPRKAKKKSTAKKKSK